LGFLTTFGTDNATFFKQPLDAHGPEDLSWLRRCQTGDSACRKQPGSVCVMCEIPSIVNPAEEFAEFFDGFSIGSKDKNPS
jgi:hypothetical protein